MGCVTLVCTSMCYTKKHHMKTAQKLPRIQAHIVLFTPEDLFEIRKKLGWTQNEMGEVLNCTGNHCAKVEGEWVEFSLKMQLRLRELAQKHKLDPWQEALPKLVLVETN